ncbi:cytochrome P450 4C1-like [Tribolium madens]|uniref:cytochrome P450 4C1-like n=1 Tax=Tribolium madens TaxID=41895 RepID=UPI001CF74EDF|nr:cytochrome P450 4C1-like [Tribolium madens]
MLSFYVLLTGISLILLLQTWRFFRKYLRNKKVLKKIHGPPETPIFGHIYIFTQDPDLLLTRIRKYSRDYYPIFRFSFPYADIVNFLDPSDIELILSTTKHLSKSKIYTFLNNWLGTGLLTSTGTKWHQRRKILTPAFHFNILQQLNKKILKKIRGPPETPIFGHMYIFTQDPDLWFTRMRKFSREYYPIFRLSALYVDIVNFLDPNDIELILSTTKHLSKSKIYTFLNNWLGTGLLTSTEEIFSVVGAEKVPTYSDLQELKYTERCIKETLRLFPSVPFISRYASEDFVTKTGYAIPEGTVMHIHIFDLHRNEEIYPEPLKFDPDRFLPDKVNERHPFAYIPFSAGPRNCIGQKFAFLELKTVLCGILRKFKLEKVDDMYEIEFRPDLVLRPKNDVKVKIEKLQ